MSIEEIQKTIEVIMNSIKNHRKLNDYYGLLTDGIACLEYSYKLIDVIVDNEQAYRQIQALEITKETLGKAEVIAKASNEYKNWKKATFLYDTLIEMNMTCKKLATSNEKELKSN